jgi:hypothetical protein
MASLVCHAVAAAVLLRAVLSSAQTIYRSTMPDWKRQKALAAAVDEARKRLDALRRAAR